HGRRLWNARCGYACDDFYCEIVFTDGLHQSFLDLAADVRIGERQPVVAIDGRLPPRAPCERPFDIKFDGFNLKKEGRDTGCRPLLHVNYWHGRNIEFWCKINPSPASNTSASSF